MIEFDVDVWKRVLNREVSSAENFELFVPSTFFSLD